MIAGIGTDIIEIERICSAIKKESFLFKTFTKAEQQYYQKKGSHPQTLAAVFCAKEAVAKAIGTGFRGFSPLDVEILHHKNGKPFLHMTAPLQSILEKEGFFHGKFHISLSHCKNYATAFVILEVP